MKLTDLKPNKMLLEGGQALKGTSAVSQADARALGPKIVQAVRKALDLPAEKVRMIGSAGNKPDGELSGDIDIAVETNDIEKVRAAVQQLGAQGKFRHMPGINIYAFAYQHGKSLIQVDLMPVPSIKYAEWSFSAVTDDLKAGLKGAHRNELLFAIAKHADRRVTKATDDGKPLEAERYYYDLGKGLMLGKSSHVGKKGQPLKSGKLMSKETVSVDPEEVTKFLFGTSFKAQDVATFQGALNAILSTEFKYANARSEILQTAAKGILGKGLQMPAQLRSA